MSESDEDSVASIEDAEMESLAGEDTTNKDDVINDDDEDDEDDEDDDDEDEDQDFENEEEINKLKDFESQSKKELLIG